MPGRQVPQKRVHWVDDGIDQRTPSPPKTPDLSLSNLSLTDSPAPDTPEAAFAMRKLQRPPPQPTARPTVPHPPLSKRRRSSKVLTPSPIIITPALHAYSPFARVFSPSPQAPVPSQKAPAASKAPAAPLSRSFTWPPASNKELAAAHPLLAFAPSYPKYTLLWDMSQQPSVYTVHAADGSVLDLCLLAGPATEPPSERIIIQCVGLGCWRPLLLQAKSASSKPSFGSSPTGGVTVEDVLDGVYGYLQRRVGAVEYGHFSPHELQKEVSRSFHRRCDSLGDRKAVETERSDGLKRLDCLLGQTNFLGLSRVKGSNDVWQLRVAPNDRLIQPKKRWSRA